MFSGFKPAPLERGEERVEARVRLPVAVRERRVEDGGVLVDDPRLLSRHAARPAASPSVRP